MSDAIENGVSIGILALNNYEPKAKWRWRLQVHAPATFGSTRPFTFMVKTSGRPVLGVEVMTTTHLNEYRNFAGKPKKPEEKKNCEIVRERINIEDFLDQKSDPNSDSPS